MYTNHRYGGGSGLLPGGHSSARETTLKAFGVRVPKKVVVAFLGVTGLLAVMGPDLSFDFGRRLNLATKCIHNVYINTDEDAVLMPPVPEREANYVPSHIKMCYEWIRRDALSIDGAISHKLNVLESRDICLDWTAPHYAMLEIIASSVLNTVLPRVRYRHGCPAHREYEEAMRGYDWSTFQTVFQEPAMAVNQDLVNPTELVREQCKACLASYDPNSDANRIRSRAFHHCFAFPENSPRYTTPISLSPVTTPTPIELPSQPLPTGNIAPVAMLLRPLRTRMWHSAAEWINVTDAPPLEPAKGTVILIDPGTLGIAPTVYDQFISPDTTSIAILAGPLCVTATLPTGENCKNYGQDLAAHFAETFPDLDGNGFEDGPGVDFQISASTAAINSRAVLADDLICAPRTASCLLPVIGKKPPTKSTVLAVPCPDCPGSGIPDVEFIDKVGTNDNTDVIQLPDSDLPPITEGQPNPPDPVPIPQPPLDVPLAPAFLDSQKPTTGDGYPDDGTPVPAPVDPEVIATQTSSDIYKAAEKNLPPEIAAVSTGDAAEPSPLRSLPGVLLDYSNTEKVPSPEEVDAAVANNEPLTVNTPQTPTEEGEEPLDPTESTELATDENSGLVAEPMSAENYKRKAVMRRNSKERIVSGYDGNYLFEVPCPSKDDVGNAVVVDEGYVITDNGKDVVVSDGVGTVTFEAPVNITTVDITEGEVADPETGETSVQEYTTIQDPVLNEPVNITIGGLVTNPDSSLEVQQPVGQLVVEPETKQGCLITMGQLSKLKKKDGKKTHTIIEGKVKSAGDENVPLSETGTVVMDEQGSLAVTAQANEFNGFLPTDPELGNSGSYQNLMLSPLRSTIQKVQMDQCQHQTFPDPIRLVMPMNDFIVFETVQTFKGFDELSWVATYFKDFMYGGDEQCYKHEEVYYAESFRNMAMCEFNEGSGKKEAVIDVYIHDGSKKINQEESAINYDITPFIPAVCNPSSDYGNKCYFRYRVDCTSLWRRRLGAMTPEDVKLGSRTGEKDRVLFAKNILRQCPELGEERVFDHFTFGGNAQNTRKIPHGTDSVIAAKIATTLAAPAGESAEK